MANTVEVVGGLGSATDSDVLEGVTYTSDNGIKRSGTFSPTAEHINYDGTSSGLLGTSVQAAIDEVSHQLAIKSDIDHTHEIDDVSGLSGRFTALSDEIGSKADTEHDHDSKYDPKDSAKIALESAKSYTDEKIATIPTPNVSGQIDIHNNSSTAHADIRSEISEITNSIPTKVSELTNDKGYITGYTETDPTVPAWAKATNKPSYTADEVGADTKGSANTALAEAKEYTNTKVSNLASTDIVDNKIGAHNTNTESHNDIRSLITGLTTRLNTLADSDDITLDQMSEVVAYIKSNKSLIDGITTSKVNVSDIIDNLTTNVGNKPLSAAQGVALKNLIDSLEKADVGLNEVDNTSDANKPVSTAQAAAILDAKKAGTDAQANLDAHNKDTTAHADIRSDITAAQNKADSAYTLADSKQDIITGIAGQFVVIGDDGNIATKTVAYAEGVAF